MDSRVKPENDCAFMPFTIPAGATRPLWYSTFNPPRTCRAGHPRALYFFSSSPGLTRGSIWRHPEPVFSSHCRTLFFLVIPGLDPGIQVKHKANLLTWIAGSSPAMTRKKNPAMTVPLCPSQFPPEQRGAQGTILTTDRSGRCLWILGSSPRMT